MILIQLLLNDFDDCLYIHVVSFTSLLCTMLMRVFFATGKEVTELNMQRKWEITHFLEQCCEVSSFSSHIGL
jgi:hypothetical protein